MAYFVFVDKTTGHVQGLNGPDLDQWPEADFQRFERDDLHDWQGTGDLAERFRVDGGELVGPNTLVSLSADKTSITADETDQAVVSVSVSGDTPPASIDIEVAGLSETVSLSKGQGRLPPITASTVGRIAVRVVDQEAYYDQGGLVITAEE